MKASELMIGDLVMSPTITPGLRVCRIVDVNGNRDCVGVYDIKDEDEYLVGKYAKYLEPIPLTEAMLKANGFEDETADFWKLRVDDKPHHYTFRLNKGGVFGGDGYNMNCNIYTITIKYVHELQHALRLCGLNNLADNFNIN